ncbi:MAG: hypothetical protein MH132_04790 [Hydrotalea sp.]|nr:hypothetical protein [Hydrotalea sp.]
MFEKFISFSITRKAFFYYLMSLSQFIIKYIQLIIIILPFFSLAQQKDCFILHNGDTIYGKYLQRNSIRQFIHIQTETGKIKIPSKDVNEFYWKGRKHRVLNDPCEGDLSVYMVLVEGSITYLHSGGREDYCPDLLIINKEVFSVKRRQYFSEQAWSILSLCTSFKAKYQEEYNTQIKKTIIWDWAYRSSRNKWLEMLRFYNLNCKEPSR